MFNTKDTYPNQTLDNDLCQAVRAGNTVYVRGQVGTDFDGNLVGLGDPRAQAEQAMRNVSDYEWVICTSANGASRVAPYLSSGATSPKLAAVGDATAIAFARDVDFVPSSANGKSLAEELPMSSGKVLVVQAQETSGEVVRMLRDRNMQVDEVAAYKTEQCLLTDAQVWEIRSADAVLIASGSAVRSWCAQAGPQVNGKFVAIGEPTQRVAAECGMIISAVAREASTAGVVAALAGVFA